LNLNSEDFAILLALESNPFMPMTELAELLGVTRVTAKKRVEDLKKREIIRKPIAMYDPKALDLHRVNVYAQVESLEKLKILELACDEHPYTHYRVRAYGGGFGLHIQFEIPRGTYSHLKVFFEELRKKGITKEQRLCVSTDVRTDAFADLTRYNSKLSKWNFSWSEWFDSLEAFTVKLPKVTKESIDYSKFNASHFKILRMLTSDGSLKQTDIKEKLGLSKTQAYREFNYVVSNYIYDIRFMYNREIFDLTETYIAFGTDISPKSVSQLYHGFKNNPPPFRSFIDILENNAILFWATMSPAQASSFAFSIWKKLKNVEIYTLDTKTSEMYWFYPDNFDFEKMNWKTSKEYIVHEPLERTLAAKK
jgi:DNA-binding Lrp family transcriptional regulator